MGADEATSVVNARGESHQVRNLIVCDSSVVPGVVWREPDALGHDDGALSGQPDRRRVGRYARSGQALLLCSPWHAARDGRERSRRSREPPSSAFNTSRPRSWSPSRSSRCDRTRAESGRWASWAGRSAPTGARWTDRPVVVTCTCTSRPSTRTAAITSTRRASATGPSEYNASSFEVGGGVELTHRRGWTGGYRALALYEAVSGLPADRGGDAWDRPFVGVESHAALRAPDGARAFSVHVRTASVSTRGPGSSRARTRGRSSACAQEAAVRRGRGTTADAARCSAGTTSTPSAPCSLAARGTSTSPARSWATIR